MHSVKLVQVVDCELVEAGLRFLLDQLSKMLFSMLALLDLSLEDFLELVDFFESCCVAGLLS